MPAPRMYMKRGLKQHLIGAGKIGGPPKLWGSPNNFWNKKLADDHPVIESGNNYGAKIAWQARATQSNGNGYYNPPYNISISTYNYSVPIWTMPPNYPRRTVYFNGTFREHDCQRGTGTYTSGSNQLTAVSSNGWANGDKIWSPNVPDGTTVVSGGGTSTLTLSNNAIGSQAGAPLWLVQGSGWIAGLQAVCLQVPIPSVADAGQTQLWAGGTDQEVAFYDPVDQKMWEFWKFDGNEASGYRASYGGRIDNMDTNDGIIPNTWGAKAISLLAIGGCIMIQDLRDGIIKHGLNIALPVTKNEHLPPATRHDSMCLLPNPGTAWNYAVPEGARFRLPANTVINPAWTPFLQMFATAARDYGMTVTDTAGVVQLQMEDPRTAGTIFSPAPDTSPMQLSDLNAFPWESLVQIGYP